MNNYEKANKSIDVPIRQLAAGKNAVQLQDNRLKTVMQQKASEPAVQKKANSTGLPDNLKTGIENLSGYSMDDVKVHYNSPKPAQLQALAYAQGTDIHIAPGQQKHLPHEAWHVVQQKQGRVKPTLQMKAAVQINDDGRLEREADAMGNKALASYKEVPIQRVKGSRAAGEKKGKSDKQIRKQKEQSNSARSFNNLKDYRPGWVRKNNITEDTVREFLKTYEHGKIRGHASGDNSQGEQAVTIRDLSAYKSWHTGQYGWH